MNNLLKVLIGCTLGLCSCGGNGGEEPQVNPTIPSEVSGAAITVTSTLSVNISTDMACYKPGQSVKFTIDNLPSNAFVRYRNLAKVILEEALTTKSWVWTPPTADFTGYLVDIYQKKSATEEVILGTIGVDVSSDWAKYPRYGFISSYGSDKTDAVIQAEMKQLARYHINGVQFQDWHYKHHWPLGGLPSNLLESYKDIANRTIYTSVIKSYIKVQHDLGMKAIFYNLCYGALDDDGAATDGVKSEWYIYKDMSHTQKDYHQLPSSWKSDISILDPSNKDWQSYLIARNNDVYSALDFDGYQIDQLGNRGTRYTYSGSKVDMLNGFASFINAMKAARPTKRLIMNAVSAYGAQNIASTGNVDFCYNEMWGNEDKFVDLRSTILANNKYSNNTLNTVFAAYMNYDRSSSIGTFNNAGVILTDAVIHALGGAHLELGGDHMLCNEYFANDNLKMNSTLQKFMVWYYDFITAYENLLRGDANENVPVINCLTAQKLNAWTASNGPQIGTITTYSKIKGTCQIVHLLNFMRANSLSWRDADGSMPESSTITSMKIKIGYSNKVSKVWVASPEQHGGVPQQLAFTQSGNDVTITIPKLMYWTMLVIE